MIELIKNFSPSNIVNTWARTLIIKSVIWVLVAQLFLNIILILNANFEANNFFNYSAEQLKNKSYLFFLLNCLCLGLVISFKNFYENNTKKIITEKDETSYLLKVLTHDLTSPLTSISLALNNIKKITNNNQNLTDELTSRTKMGHLDYGANDIALQINKSQRALDSIDKLLQEIKEYETSKATKSYVRKSLTSWGQIFDELDFLISEGAKNKNINIHYPTTHRSDFFETDQRILVYQILNNILSNSIKFSPLESRVEINLSIDKSYYVLSIQDFGNGIPKETWLNYQKNSNLQSRPGTLGEKGTGFGLLIIKNSINLLGGYLMIENSNLEKDNKELGTLIKIWLPKS